MLANDKSSVDATVDLRSSGGRGGGGGISAFNLVSQTIQATLDDLDLRAGGDISVKAGSDAGD